MSEDKIFRRFRWVSATPVKLSIAGAEAVLIDPDQTFNVSGSPASVNSVLQEMLTVSAAKGYGSVVEIQDDGVQPARRRAGFHPFDE